MSGNLCYCKNREGKIAKRKVIQWIAAVAIMLVGKLSIELEPYKLYSNISPKTNR